jgi:hypothetical protein
MEKVTTVKEVLKEFEKHNITDWEDSSDSRDLCDSIYNKKKELQIYIPNSLNQNEDNEEWNTYNVWSWNKEYSGANENVKFQTRLQNISLVELIKYLKGAK